MIDVRDIHSLSEFQRNTRAHLKQLRKTGRPAVLTVRGRARIVVQDAEAYQRLLDVAANAAAIVGIQRGLQGANEGTGEPADAVFEEIEHNFDIAPPE